jgi:hypothetical protein
MTTYYGFFDPKRADERGFSVYKTPDNHEVKVTAVISEKDIPKTKYVQKESIGVVTEWVSSHFTPQNPPPSYKDFF